AATRVDPLPANGSNTVPPGGVTNRTSHAINSVGLTVGCLFASTCPPSHVERRSRFDAFFDSSGGVTLKYLLKKASGSSVMQFAGKRPFSFPAGVRVYPLP